MDADDNRWAYHHVYPIFCPALWLNIRIISAYLWVISGERGGRVQYLIAVSRIAAAQTHALYALLELELATNPAEKDSGFYPEPAAGVWMFDRSELGSAHTKPHSLPTRD